MNRGCTDLRACVCALARARQARVHPATGPIAPFPRGVLCGGYTTAKPRFPMQLCAPQNRVTAFGGLHREDGASPLLSIGAPCKYSRYMARLGCSPINTQCMWQRAAIIISTRCSSGRTYSRAAKFVRTSARGRTRRAL